MVGLITKPGGTNARTGGTFEKCPTSYTVKICPDLKRGITGKRKTLDEKQIADK